MTVNANEVLNGEMLRHVRLTGTSASMRFAQFERRQRAQSRREAWEDAARRRFPGRPDWEAFDLQREWDEEHR